MKHNTTNPVESEILNHRRGLTMLLGDIFPWFLATEAIHLSKESTKVYSNKVQLTKTKQRRKTLTRIRPRVGAIEWFIIIRIIFRNFNSNVITLFMIS